MRGEGTIDNSVEIIDKTNIDTTVALLNKENDVVNRLQTMEEFVKKGMRFETLLQLTGFQDKKDD